MFNAHLYKIAFPVEANGKYVILLITLEGMLWLLLIVRRNGKCDPSIFKGTFKQGTISIYLEEQLAPILKKVIY
jgi:hypothetical protein